MRKILIPPLYFSLGLLAVDVVSLVFLLKLVYHLRIGEWHSDQWTLALPVTLTLMSMYILDVYRTDQRVSGMRAPVRTITAVVFAGFLSAVTAYLMGYWGNLFGRGVLPIALLVFAIWAALIRYFVSTWARSRAESVRWLVLGVGEPAVRLWRDFRNAETEGEMYFLALDEHDRSAATSHGLPAPRGTLDDFPSLTGYTGLIITLDPPLPDVLVQRLMQIRFSGTPVYDLPDFYEHFWLKVPVLHLQGGWLVFSYAFDLLQNPLGLRLKRILDVSTSLLMLLSLAPLMVLIVLAIRVDSPGSAVYRQIRVGEGKKSFTLYKFRSMRADAESRGPQWTGVDDSRITRVGKILRVTRLDELPQLWNVLRGDMSFIGPRPERPEFTGMLEKQIPYYDSRHLVKPGITGWAQVMYAYGASVDDAREKLQYDLYYIKHYSLLLDIAILFKTIRVVLLGRGR